jgi:hypothetical protein
MRRVTNQCQKPARQQGLVASYLLTKKAIKTISRAMMPGAKEKIIIQIASFLNVNLSNFMFPFPGLPSLTVGLLTRAHVPRLLLTMVIML